MADEHLDHPAVRAVLESEEYRRAVAEHPAEDLPETDHPEGGLVRDGRGEPPPEARELLATRKVTYLMASYRNPGAVWLPSPNFWPGRLGHDMSAPSWVTLHTTVCCWQSAWGRFQQPAQQASSTYLACLDGHVIQFADERDGPWTNGTSSGIGSNLDSITIEHEDCGDYDGPRTAALYAASAQLVYEICERYGIPIDRAHIIKHNECHGSATACPDSLDVDRIVRMAAAQGSLPATPSGGTSMAVSGDMITIDGVLHYFDHVGAGDGTSHLRWSACKGGAGELSGPSATYATVAIPYHDVREVGVTQSPGPTRRSGGQFVSRILVRVAYSDGTRLCCVLDPTDSSYLVQDWFTPVPGAHTDGLVVVPMRQGQALPTE
jgi:N-acetylmuramoyl-L-alanine amidase